MHKTKLTITALLLMLAAAACSEKQPTTPLVDRSMDEIAVEGTTADIPDVLPAATVETEYVGPSAGPLWRDYRDFPAWFGENRAFNTLVAAPLSRVPGVDLFVAPVAASIGGIPAGTRVVLYESNGFGSPAAAANQNAAIPALSAWLGGGRTLIVDMGDNLPGPGQGYRAPGIVGTPNYVFPDNCRDVSLTAYARGPDNVLGTADDHPAVKGPDGMAGTGDDWNNSNIDMSFSCSVVHGNLEQGMTLPGGPGSGVLITARFGGIERAVAAEYCFNGGRVIVDTFTKEFQGQNPGGTGPSVFMRNLFAYAQSPASSCNRPPTASAGPDRVEECTGHHTTLQIDGAAQDPDNNIVSIQWFVDNDPNPVASGTADPSIVFTKGVHVLKVVVKDAFGETATDVAIITIQDTQAPSASLSASPNSLWPPNHKYVDITVAFSASDACDPNALTVTGKVWSDEPDDANGNGDGNTTADVLVNGTNGSSNANPAVSFNPLTDKLQLRAERAGGGGGRTYTIQVTVTDPSGNSTTTSTTVKVPHNQ